MIKEKNSKNTVKLDITDNSNNKEKMVKIKMKKVVKAQMRIRMMTWMMTMKMMSMMMILIIKRKKNSKFFMNHQQKMVSLIDCSTLFGNKSIMLKISKTSKNKINKLVNKLLMLMSNYNQQRRKLETINLKN